MSNNEPSNQGTLEATPLSAEAFEFLRSTLYAHTGISLCDAKQTMVRSRLQKRLRKLKLETFDEYCEHLRRDSSETENFISSLTTNLTSFFRESHHFERLAELLRQPRPSSDPLKIWSTACSTGEEPYSIAMTIADAADQNPVSRLARVLATDIDREVLARAARGVYSTDTIRSLDPALVKRHFQRGRANHNTEQIRVRPELRDQITFRQLNLLQEWPFQQSMDVIFCRNVLIYFDQPTQVNLVRRFVDHLRPGGTLFLGHSESRLGTHPALVAHGQTEFRKCV